MIEQIVHWLAYGSLAFGGIAAYLQLNKLWARKHLREVAASISIPGVLFEGVKEADFVNEFARRLGLDSGGAAGWGHSRRPPAGYQDGTSGIPSDIATGTSGRATGAPASPHG